MRKRIASPDAPFQRAEYVARMTGIPISHIRAGVKDGTIPCMWFGKSCLVNMPAYLRKLGVTPDNEKEG